MGSKLKEATVRSNIKNFVQRKLCSVYGYESVCVCDSSVIVFENDFVAPSERSRIWLGMTLCYAKATQKVSFLSLFFLFFCTQSKWKKKLSRSQCAVIAPKTNCSQSRVKGCSAGTVLALINVALEI